MNPGRRRIISVLLSAVLIFVQVSGDTYGREEQGDGIYATGIGESLSVGDSGELEILAQPEGISASPGNQVAFEIRVNRTDATFQWYRGDLELPDEFDEELSLEDLVDAYAQWQPLDGQENSTLQFVAGSDDIPGWYRCVVTAGGQRAVSRAAGLFMSIMPLADVGTVYLDPEIPVSGDGLTPETALKTLAEVQSSMDTFDFVYLVNPMTIGNALTFSRAVTIKPYKWDANHSGKPMFQIATGSGSTVTFKNVTIAANGEGSEKDILPFQVDSGILRLEGDCELDGYRQAEHAVKIQNYGALQTEAAYIHGFTDFAILNAYIVRIEPTAALTPTDIANITDNGGGIQNTSANAYIRISEGAVIDGNKKNNVNRNVDVTLGNIRLEEFGAHSLISQIGITTNPGEFGLVEDPNHVPNYLDFLALDDADNNIYGIREITKNNRTEIWKVYKTAQTPIFDKVSDPVLVPKNTAVSITDKVFVDVQELFLGELTLVWYYAEVFDGERGTWMRLDDTEQTISGASSEYQNGLFRYPYTLDFSSPACPVLNEGEYRFRVHAVNNDSLVMPGGEISAEAYSDVQIEEIQVFVFEAPEFVSNQTNLPNALVNEPYTVDIKVTGSLPMTVELVDNSSDPSAYPNLSEIVIDPQVKIRTVTNDQGQLVEEKYFTLSMKANDYATIPGEYRINIKLSNAGGLADKTETFNLKVVDRLGFTFPANKDLGNFYSEQIISGDNVYIEAKSEFGGPVTYELALQPGESFPNNNTSNPLKIETKNGKFVITGSLPKLTETTVYQFTVRASNEEETISGVFRMTVYPEPEILKFNLKYDDGNPNSEQFVGAIDPAAKTIDVILEPGYKAENLIPVGVTTNPALDQLTFTPPLNGVINSGTQTYKIASPATPIGQEVEYTLRVHVLPQVMDPDVVMPFAVVGTSYTYIFDPTGTGTITMELESSSLPGVLFDVNQNKLVINPGVITDDNDIVLEFKVTAVFDNGTVRELNQTVTIPVYPQPSITKLTLNTSYSSLPSIENNQIIVVLPSDVGSATATEVKTEPASLGSIVELSGGWNNADLYKDDETQTVTVTIPAERDKGDTYDIRPAVTVTYSATAYVIPEITTENADLPVAVVDYVYNNTANGYALQANPNTKSVKYALDPQPGDTGLPDGLSLDVNGKITGTPSNKNAEGPYTFTVRITNAAYPDASATKRLTIQLYENIAITSLSITASDNNVYTAIPFQHSTTEVDTIVVVLPDGVFFDPTDVPDVTYVPDIPGMNYTAQVGSTIYNKDDPVDFSGAHQTPVKYTLTYHNVSRPYDVYVGTLPGVQSTTFPDAIEGADYNKSIAFTGSAGISAVITGNSGSLYGLTATADASSVTLSHAGSSKPVLGDYEVDLKLENEITRQLSRPVTVTLGVKVWPRPLVESFRLEGATDITKIDPVDYNDTGSIQVALPYSVFAELGSTVPDIKTIPSQDDGASVPPITWNYSNDSSNNFVVKLVKGDIEAESKYQAVFYIIPELDFDADMEALPPATVGVAYEYVIPLKSDALFQDISLSTDEVLPAGLSLVRESDRYVIRGTPTAADTASVAFIAANNSVPGQTIRRTFGFTVRPEPRIKTLSFQAADGTIINNDKMSSIHVTASDNTLGLIDVTIPSGHGFPQVTPIIEATEHTDEPVVDQSVSDPTEYTVSLLVPGNEATAGLAHTYNVKVYVAPKITTPETTQFSFATVGREYQAVYDVREDVTGTLVWPITTLPAGARVDPEGKYGIQVSFTPTTRGKLEYTVVVDNETTQTATGVPHGGKDSRKYEVFVYPDPEIESFTLPNQDRVEFTTTTDPREIHVVLLPGSQRTDLTPEITLTEGASYRPSGARDFTQPQIYTVSTPGTYGVSHDYQVTVDVMPEITTEKVLPQGRTNKDYGPLPIEATGTGTITFEKGDNFPGDFDLTSEGVLTGNTAVSGTYRFKVKAKSEFGEYEQEFELEISAAPEIHTQELSEGYLLIQYNDKVEAYGDPSTFSIASGNLPNGLSLASDGTITGVPERSGLFSFTVRAANHAGIDEKTYYVRVYEGPRITKDLPEYMEVGESVPEVILEVATSADPSTVTWQWYFNGSPIEGETTDALVLQPPREGYYHVVLTSTINGMSTQSRICHLVIVPDRNGRIIVEVDDLEGPATNITNVPELIDRLVTDEELYDVTYNGVTVRLTVTLRQLLYSQISSEDWEAIQAYRSPYFFFMYLDITLTKSIERPGEAAIVTELHEPGVTVGLRIELMNSKNKAHTYGILGINSAGYMTFFKDKGQENEYITVHPNHFSLYAMASYVSGSGGGNGGGGDGGKNQPDPSDNFYTVTYLANLDEYDGNPVIATAKYAVRSTVRVTAKVPECEGYVFTGWNTKENGSGKTYRAGDTFVITEDITLYAQWEEDAIMAVLLQEPPAKDYTGNPSTGSYPIGRMTYSSTMDAVVDTQASGRWQSFLQRNALGATISTIGLLVLFWLRSRREEKDETASDS